MGYPICTNHLPSRDPRDERALLVLSVVAEEAREKQFAHRAITEEVGDMPPAPAYEMDRLYVADAAVKVSVFASIWGITV